jgi:hypothetical protein
MKKFNSNTLLDQLQSDTRQLLITLKQLQQQDPEKLVLQPAPGKWSVTEVIEHLNIYGRHYLPQLEKALDTSTRPANASYQSGWLGNYFTNSMLPKPGNRIANKMKTPTMARPSADLDPKKVIDEFEQQEIFLLELLHKARAVDLSGQRIPISIAPFIKLKMGDIFRFLIAHHQRHFVQIHNTLLQVNVQ